MLMRLVLCALMTTLLILPGPATALDEQKPTKNIVQLPPGTLNSAELFNLFRHKTVFAVTAVQKRESVSYYSPGGVVHQLRNGIKHTGRWRVTATGRICLQMENRPENAGSSSRKTVCTKSTLSARTASTSIRSPTRNSETATRWGSSSL